MPRMARPHSGLTNDGRFIRLFGCKSLPIVNFDAASSPQMLGPQMIARLGRQEAAMLVHGSRQVSDLTAVTCCFWLVC